MSRVDPRKVLDYSIVSNKIKIDRKIQKMKTEKLSEILEKSHMKENSDSLARKIFILIDKN